jgi:methionyl-tRNA formyltransferase
MAGNLNILVLSDSPILERAKPIFQKVKANRWTFTNSDDINPKIDWKHIINTYDLVFSLHCKKIFPRILSGSVRCINIHPGYNPFNKGMYPHVWSIINGKPAGATIHVMNEDIDGGPIICQSAVHTYYYDTSETLYERVVNEELTLLENHLERIIKGDYKTYHYPKEGNYNSLADFKRLCNIDPSAVGTFEEHYNLIRALSHGDFRNAHLDDTYFKLQIL